MKDIRLEQLKNEYMNMPVPLELESVVKSAIDEGRKSMKAKRNFKKIRITAATAAAVLIAVTIAVNSSEAFAVTMSKVPVVGSIVKVLTFREYKVNEENFKADIKVPAIQGLQNKTLETSLNEKYLDEDKQLYEEFMKEMGELKDKSQAHIGVSTGYEVKTDNDTIFSVGRYVLTTAGSSNTVLKYDTIDKKKQVLITLPSLFKDDSYIDIISANIIDQMKEAMKTQPGVIYWIEANAEFKIEPFTKISKDQSFYINKDGKLVICFNKYEVAPGVMGTPEFVIPTEVISKILVGNEYIK